MLCILARCPCWSNTIQCYLDSRLDASSMNDIVVDAFDDIFFSKHGVGDVPIDKELANIKHQINPNIANARELEFARLVVRGENKVNAYIKAFGYDGTEFHRTTFYAHTNRLMKRPRVATAIYDLQKKVEDLAGEDMAQLIKELNEDRKLARDLGQPAAAISAVKVKASLLGLDNVQPTNNITINLGDEQKKQIIERIGKQLIAKNAIDAEYKVIGSNE